MFENNRGGLGRLSFKWWIIIKTIIWSCGRAEEAALPSEAPLGPPDRRGAVRAIPKFDAYIVRGPDFDRTRSHQGGVCRPPRAMASLGVIKKWAARRS